MGVVKTWIGGDGSWMTSGNWSPSGIPVTDDYVHIHSSCTIDDVPSVSLYGLLIDASDDTITLNGNGNTITLTNGTVGNDFEVTQDTFFIMNCNITMSSLTKGGIDGLFWIGNGNFTVSNCDVTTVSSSGIIFNYGVITNTTASKLVFDDGSNYYHQQNGGTIPKGTWHPNSYLYVFGNTSTSITSLTYDPVWGNFIWDNLDQTNYTSYLTTSTSVLTFTIQGNLHILNTGLGGFGICSTTGNKILNVMGDIVVGDTLNNAIFDLKKQGASGNLTINLGGNLLVNTGGTLTQTMSTTSTISFGSSSATGATNVTVGGDGVYDLNNYCEYQIYNYPNGKTLTLNNNIEVSVFSIYSGATLDCSGKTITCTTMGISPGGNIKIDSVNGINGNIFATMETYSPSANYEYDGTSNQVIGSHLPTNIGVLTINNPNGITLSKDIYCTEIVIIQGSTDCSPYILYVDGEQYCPTPEPPVPPHDEGYNLQFNGQWLYFNTKLIRF